MKRVCLFIVVFLGCTVLYAQKAIDSVKFFKDDDIIEMTLTTDIRKIKNEKRLNVFQDAAISMNFGKGLVINDTIGAGPRGHFRRDFCDIPPLSLNFRQNKSKLLSNLGTLKLVIGCGNKADDEQLVLREYLCYKIYNLLEEKSFRVRLLHVNFTDSRGKMKPFSQYAFLIEDDNDLAARHGCIKKDKTQVMTEATNRHLTTKVSIFQYMISNGDWSIPANHNIKLIYDRKNDKAAPYAIPYDFDHSGFVNAAYALPNELLGTEKVTERVYRGFPRNMEELQLVLDDFRKQKDDIYKLIRGFDLLKERTRKDIIEYMDEFYKIINNKTDVQSIFIDNARRS
jgi:hypothetical protein